MSNTLDRLIQLQNLVKRDSEGYADEFRLQLKNFHAELAVLRLGATNGAGAGGTSAAFGQGSADARQDFAALTIFLSHVCHCYPKEMANFPSTLLSLLEKHADSLDGEVRRTLVQALILLRNKGLVPAVPLLKAFFDLFRVRDKMLRELLFSHIVADLRVLASGRSHKHAGDRHSKGKGKEKAKAEDSGKQQGKNDAADSAAACRAIQAHLYSLVSDAAPAISARKSLDVLIELYRRQVWTDARTVNVIAQALVSTKPKLLVTACKFFLNLGSGEEGAGGDEDEGEESEEEYDGQGNAIRKGNPNVDPKQVKALEQQMQHAKKTRKKQKQLAKQLAALKKSKKQGGKEAAPSFPAIQLLHDPQGLAEKMLAQLRKSAHRFELRLLQLNLITRIVGTHKLLLLPLYSFIQRYLSSHQSHVTQVLAYLLQSVHDLVPPDEVSPIVRLVANNFVNETAGPETMQVGINALRELFSRCPTVLEEEGMGSLIHDLVLYKKSGSKGVVAAARSVLNLVREWYPALLKKRDRGRDVSTDPSKAAARPSAYGARAVATGIEGTELLALALARKAQRNAARDAAAGAGSDSEEEEDGEEDGEEEEDVDMGEGEEEGEEAASAAASLSVDPASLPSLQDVDEWRKLQLGKVKSLREAGKAGKARALLATLRQVEEAVKAGAAGKKKGSKEAALLHLRPATGKRAVVKKDEADEEADELADLLLASEDEDEEEDEEGEDGHVHGESCDHGHGEEEEEDDDVDDDEEDDDEDEEEDEDEDDAMEEEEEEEQDVGSLGRVSSSHAASSKASQKAALAATLAPLVGRQGMGSTSAGAALESSRILTPKDYARIKALQGKLAERGVFINKPADILALLQGGKGLPGHGAEAEEKEEEKEAEGGAGVKRKRRGTVSEEEWARLQARKKRRGGRGLGLADDEVPDKEEEDEAGNELAMPGVSYAPPTTAFNPLAIEAVETSHKRKQAERLLDLIRTKQGKGKFEGKRPGGGLTNDEKRRMKNYVMLRKSGAVAGKLRRSLKEQGRVLSKRIKGDKTMDKRKKQRRRRA